MASPDRSLSPSVGAAFESGRAAYSSVSLSVDAFAAAVARSACTGSTLALEPVARDVFLAAACEAGTAGAWEALAAEYRPRLRALVTSRGVDPAEVDELVSDLFADLALPP